MWPTLANRAACRQTGGYQAVLRYVCTVPGAISTCRGTVGEHDDLVIAVAPRRCPAYGVDAVLGPFLDDTAGAAGLSPPGPWRYWMMGRPVSASMTMVLT